MSDWCARPLLPAYAAGTARHGESAKLWMSVIAEIKNRGAADVLFIVCDGLKGLRERGAPLARFGSASSI